MSASIALRLSDVVKTYPGVVALKGVSFEVQAGEVHGLVGENGAGKSTLMGVAAGSILPDSGKVEIGGTPMDEPSPTAAQQLGLAVVYQHPALLPDLTVAENLAFAMPPGRRPKLSKAVEWARGRLEAADAAIDPRRRVDQLTVAERHLLEIAKALTLEPRVLILDEPTEPLVSEEIERLFARVESLKQQGTAIVYISHRIPEVQGIADRITVLRDGEARGTFPIDEVDEDDIVRLIVGRSVETVFPPKLGERGASANGAKPPVELRGFSGIPGFENVDLTLRPGEIVGLAGVSGNGQKEFIRALAGLYPSRGEMLIDGTRVSLRSAEAAARAGISYMPGDRHEEGLLLSLSVRENAGLASLPAFRSRGLVRRREEVASIEATSAALAIRTPSLETPVASLSGGNQQKVVLARSLLAQPRVLLADEPTQGVDAGARVEIYKILRDAASEGAAVVVLSSDAIELEGLCDRVLIFSRGHVVKELEGEQVSEDEITGAALRSTSLRGRREQVEASRLSRFLSGDFAPSIILAIAIVALALYTNADNSFFLTERNIAGLLTLMTALGFVALGQLVVMQTGGIDLSVGPLTGFLVVIASFFVNDGEPGGTILLGLLLMVLAAAFVGLVNGTFVRAARMSPVIATLITFIVLQGVALLLRKTPDGPIHTQIATEIGTTFGGIPVAFVIVVALALALEWALRRTRWGLELRAVGSREQAAHALGARVERTHVLAYVLCSLLTLGGGIMLMAQIGIGDASAGETYTLASITAVVLGGASIFGGRGSFVGVIFGALLIQEVTNATTFLGLGQAWQYWLVGLLTLIAAGFYSKARALTVRKARAV